IIIGNYIIKATLTNTLNEVVDERTWSVNVNHPSLPKITSRNLYAGSSSPSWNTKVKAYNGTAYSASTPYNFVPCNMVGSVCVPVNHPGATPQADFCVTVEDGEGTYA